MAVNLNRHQLKLTVFGAWLNKINPQNVYLNLRNSNLNKKPQRSTVFHWYKQFNEGKSGFQDQPRSGRPATSTNPTKVSIVKGKLDQERRTTVRKLSIVSKIPKSSVHRILTKKLNVKKLKSICIPHKLTKKEMRDRVLIAEDMLAEMRSNLPESLDRIVTCDETYLYFEPVYVGNERKWAYDHEETPKQPKFNKLTHKKRMFTIFFNRKGEFLVEYQPLNQAASAATYCNLLEKFGHDIVLHDDNAPIHTCEETLQFRIQNRIPRLGHPPYSPDLAPLDFWLIRKIKKELEGHIYLNVENLHQEVSKIMENIPKEEFAKCFDEWMIRLMKCIDEEGKYFEFKKREIKNKK